MKILQTQWDKSEVGRLLHIFTGFISHTLEHATPQQLIRAQHHLPLIFWRWYFLLMKSSHMNNTSPYFHAIWRKDVENWPSAGMFLLQAHLTFSHTADQPQVTTEVTADYISFHEQPLLIDLKRNIAGMPRLFVFDQKYASDIAELSTMCQLINMGVNAKDFDITVLSNYLDLCFLRWREHNEDIKRAFRLEEWLFMWRDILQKIYDRDASVGYGSDELNTTLVLWMRAHGDKQYGYLPDELDESKRIRNKRALQWTDLWTDFAYFVLVPFSWYTLLLVPVFTDQQIFEKELHESLNGYYENLSPLHSAFNTLHMTPFGKTFFSRYINKKII